MRITGGILKGRKLNFTLPAHVRPSTDFMRESLFNWLYHHYEMEDATVLDLFSGSGIISLEFISRNVQHCTSVDLDKKNIALQRKTLSDFNIENCEVAQADVWKFINDLPSASFDFIFADPPYALKNISDLPKQVSPLLTKGGVFIMEHGTGLPFELTPFLQKRYGESTLSFFQN